MCSILVEKNEYTLLKLFSQKATYYTHKGEEEVKGSFLSMSWEFSHISRRRLPHSLVQP